MIQRLNAANRRAVTLLEVIFAIGVVLIGLLGVMSILPLAGRRAQDSLTYSEGAAIGSAVMNELLSKKFLTSGRLIQIASSADSFADARMIYNSTASPKTLSTGLVPANDFESFCIDPLYVSTQERTRVVTGRYSDAFFPYYMLDYDPLTNPTTADASISPPWPAFRPAMHRVGIRWRDLDPATTAQWGFDLERSRRLVESNDDLLTVKPKDRTLAARLFGLSGVASGIEYGRRVPAGEFTWIATVDPDDDKKYASVAVVVMRNRDRGRDYPEVEPAVPETKPLKNGVNERIAYVSRASGFQGGAGGSVDLVGNDAVLSDISTGNWIMLSRRFGTPPDTSDVHQWYRVAAIDGKPTKLTTGTAWPTTTGTVPTVSGKTVWLHRVYLDGADWSFGFEVPGPEDFSNNTFATIASDVVSVTQRVIPLKDL